MSTLFDKVGAERGGGYLEVLCILLIKPSSQPLPLALSYPRLVSAVYIYRACSAYSGFNDPVKKKYEWRSASFRSSVATNQHIMRLREPLSKGFLFFEIENKYICTYISN